MTPLDTELFNEFKKLDKLLRDSRKTERGVSDYIDEMKATSAYESRYISNWRTDLDGLWYCRHLRNKLAHDATSEDYPLCDPENVAFLRQFRARVLRGEDPLALLNKRRYEARQRDRSSTPPRTYTYSRQSTGTQEPGCLSCILWMVVSAVAVPCVMEIIRLLTQ